MHTNTKKVLAAICMGATMLTSVPAVAVAATTDNPVHQQNAEVAPHMTYIQNAMCDLSFSGSTAYVNCSVTGYLTATKAKVIAELQMKNGSSWIPVKIWTDTQYGDEAKVDESYPITVGATYRVKATVTVWEGSQSETRYLYT